MKTAVYKGRRYKLEFLGDTKHGKRAKLAFMDGSKEFWVAANLVSDIREDTQQSNSNRVSRGCWECRVCGEENSYSSSRCWECGASK